MKNKFSAANKVIMSRYEGLREVAMFDMMNMDEDHPLYETVVRPLAVISETVSEITDAANGLLRKGVDRADIATHPALADFIEEVKSEWASITEEDFVAWATEYHDWKKDIVAKAMAA